MKIGGISFTPVRRAGGRPGRSSRPSATSAPGDHSNEATSRRHPRLADPLTTRAYEAAQPAQAPDMLSARRLAAEPLVNLLKRPGAINPRDRIPCDFHPATLSRGLTGVKGIPYLGDWQLLIPRAPRQPPPAGRLSASRACRRGTPQCRRRDLPSSAGAGMRHGCGKVHSGHSRATDRKTLSARSG